MNTTTPLPSDLMRLAVDQAGLLSYHQLRAGGCSRGLISRRVAKGRWLHLTRNVYEVLPQHPWDDVHDARRLRSAWIALLAVPQGISVGPCALALHGVWGLPLRLTPEVALPEGRYSPGPPGVTVRRYRQFEHERFHTRRIATTTTALAQGLTELPRNNAVAVLDSALHLGKITPADLPLLDSLLAGRRGARLARTWLGLADHRAQSPFETLTRLQCLDAKLPPPVLQVAVKDSKGTIIARGDLGWRCDDGSWVLIDLDGKKYHDTPEAVLADRHRQNAIALTARHTHLRFSWADLRNGSIPATIARALALKRTNEGNPSPGKSE